MPEIKQILGLYLIGEAPIEQDQTRNTDLIVLKLDAVRVACRIRRAEDYLGKYNYANEFTIRTTRPNTGNRTELAKIIAGFGDYFFYGFGDSSTGKLARWGLGDLSEFRLWFNSRIVQTGRVPGVEKKNNDGSSDFRVFTWVELPPAFRVATSFAVENAA